MCVSQSRLKHALGGLFERDGTACRKIARVRARPARAGERVETITADGLETANTASRGDYLVENQTAAGERYLVGADSFLARYRPSADSGGDWSMYEPRPGWVVRVLPVDDRVLERLGKTGHFRIEASWEGTQPVRRGDFLVATPNLDSIYRVARKEFGETYEPTEPGAEID